MAARSSVQGGGWSLRRFEARSRRKRAAGPGRRTGSAWFGLLGAGVLLAPPALAQAPPGAPRAPTREEVERDVPRPDDRPSRVTVEGGVEHAPCPLAGAAFRDIAFTVTDVRFDNLRGLTAEDLRPAWADYAGTRQPVATIC